MGWRRAEAVKSQYQGTSTRWIRTLSHPHLCIDTCKYTVYCNSLKCRRNSGRYTHKIYLYFYLGVLKYSRYLWCHSTQYMLWQWFLRFMCFIQFPFRAHSHPISHVRVGNVTSLQSKLSPQQAVLCGGGLCSSLIILHKVLELNSLGGFRGRRHFGPHSRGSKLRLRISLVRRGPDARAKGELWGGWEHVKACLSPRRGSGVKVPSSPAAEHEWIWGNLHEYSI